MQAELTAFVSAILAEPAEPNTPRSNRRGLIVPAQIAGLMGTGWIVWSRSIVPRLAHQSLWSIAAETLQYTLLACLAGALVTLALYFLIVRSVRRDAWVCAVRTSSTAIWFAPATILLSALSPVALPAALVLVTSVTHLLYSQWRQTVGAGPPVDRTRETRPFQLLRVSIDWRDLAAPLALAVAVQSAVLASFMEYPLLAGVLFSLSVALLMLLYLASGPRQEEAPPSLPRSIFGLILTIMLATGLTVGGLAGEGDSSDWLPDASPHARLSPVEGARALLRRMFMRNRTVRGKEQITTVYTEPSASVNVGEDGFPGVILWPEVKPQTILIAPTPRWLQSPVTAVPTKPFSLLFDGQYWMFRPPNSQPPPKSYFQRGSPAVLSFLSTGHIPLAMEAHQRLGHPVDLGCCSAIDVAIRNADRYPGTVALELLLVEESPDSRRSESLGTLSVQSRPHASAFDPVVEPVSETLHFNIPAGGALREFNEFEVVFHRDTLRIDRSARIAIERFVFVPR